MTLREMSDQYQAHADAIAQRMEELRRAAHAAEEPAGMAYPRAAADAAGSAGTDGADTVLLRQGVS